MIVRIIAALIILVQSSMDFGYLYSPVSVSDLNVILPATAFIILLGLVLNLFRRIAVLGAAVVLVAVLFKLLILGPANLAHVVMLASSVILLVASRRTRSS